MQKTTPNHPLKNPNSPHYHITGDESIHLMERMYSKRELLAWAKITAMKYRMRIGKKDAPEKEIEKISTYEAYYAYLIAELTSEDVTQVPRTKEDDAQVLDCEKIRQIWEKHLREPTTNDSKGTVNVK